MALLAAACDRQAPIPTAAPVSALVPAAALAARVPVAIDASAPFLILPYAVAKALKYDKAEGLDVDWQVMPGGAQAAAALLSGSAMFSGGSLEQAVKAQAQGQELKMLVAFTRYPGIAVMVRGDLKDQIKEIKDLKGRKVGVTAIGALTHLLAITLAARAGLKPDDITIVAVGSSTMAVAFEKKEIDVGFNADPFATQLLKSRKVALLADLRAQADSERALDGEFPSTGLLATGDTIKNKPEIVQKMVNALVRAVIYLRAHTAGEIAAVLTDDVTGNDKLAWIDALNASRPALSLDGRVTQAGVENAVAAYRLFGSISPDALISVEALYDNSWMDRVK